VAWSELVIEVVELLDCVAAAGWLWLLVAGACCARAAKVAASGSTIKLQTFITIPPIYASAFCRRGGGSWTTFQLQEAHPTEHVVSDARRCFLLVTLDMDSA